MYSTIATFKLWFIDVFTSPSFDFFCYTTDHTDTQHPKIFISNLLWTERTGIFLMQGHLAVRSHDTIPKIDLTYIKRKRRWKAVSESALIWQRRLINILGQHTSLYLNHQCSLHHMVLPQDASQPTRQRSHVSALTKWSAQTIHLAEATVCVCDAGIDLGLPCVH